MQCRKNVRITLAYVSFKAALKDCVSTSDRIGYIYWFFVLITISCGGATGVFVTYKNRTAMERVCTDKLDYYMVNYANKIPALQSTSTSSSAATASSFSAEVVDGVQFPNRWGAAAIHEHVAIIEDQLK